MKRFTQTLLLSACACSLTSTAVGCSQARDARRAPPPPPPTVTPGPAPEAVTSSPPPVTPSSVPEAVAAGTPPPAVEPAGAADSPDTLGLRPGDLLPEDIRFEGATHQARGPEVLVVLWEDAGPEEQAPQRLFVYTDDAGRITRLQWARPGKGLVTGAELIFDFIVPPDAFAAPVSPDAELLAIGDGLDAAITSGDLQALVQAVGALAEAHAGLDMSRLKGPLVLGVIESQLDAHISPGLLGYAREPCDIAEYAFYTVGRVPDESLFPSEVKRWRSKDELMADRGAWFMSIMSQIFSFYDMGGIAETGFDVTIRHHDYWSAREARIRNLGNRRIRIEDRVIPGSEAGLQ